MAIILKYGVNQVENGDIVGLTVRQAIERFRPILGLPTDIQVARNNQMVGLDEVLRDGDQLTLFKAAGSKGATIKYGVNQIASDAINGATLRNALRAVQSYLGLPSDNVSAQIGSRQLDPDYIIQPTDTITVFKAAGEKGDR